MIKEKIKQWELANDKFATKKIWLWNDSVLDNIKYILYRNRGYAFRKAYRLLTDLIEVLFIAMLCDVMFLKALVVLPFIHFFMGMINENFMLLFRIGDNEEKSIDKLSTFVVSNILFVLLLGLSTSYFYEQVSTEKVILNIFIFRMLIIWIEVNVFAYTLDVVAFKRIFVNPRVWLVNLSICTLLAIITYSLIDNAVVALYLIIFILGMTRILNDVYFVYCYKKYIRIMGSIALHVNKFKSLDLLSRLLSINSLFGLGLFILSSKYVIQNTDGIPWFILFMLVLITRVSLRPMRSIHVDVLQMLKKKQFNKILKINKFTILFSITILLFFTSLIISTLESFHLDRLVLLFIFILVNNVLVNGFVSIGGDKEVLFGVVILRYFLPLIIAFFSADVFFFFLSEQLFFLYLIGNMDSTRLKELLELNSVPKEKPVKSILDISRESHSKVIDQNIFQVFFFNKINKNFIDKYLDAIDQTFSFSSHWMFSVDSQSVFILFEQSTLEAEDIQRQLHMSLMGEVEKVQLLDWFDIIPKVKIRKSSEIDEILLKIEPSLEILELKEGIWKCGSKKLLNDNELHRVETLINRQKFISKVRRTIHNSMGVCYPLYDMNGVFRIYITKKSLNNISLIVSDQSLVRCFKTWRDSDV